MKQFLAVSIFLIIMIPLAVAEPSCSKVDISVGMTKMQKFLIENTGTNWIKNAYVCDMGRYKIAVPVESKTNNIFIWTEEGALFSVEKGIGVSIHGSGPNKRSSKTAVNVQDRNKDGVFDQISFSVFDKDGNQIQDIIDTGMDGEIDHKIKVND